VTPAQSVGTLMRKVGMAVRTVLSAVTYRRFYIQTILGAVPVPTGAQVYGAPCLPLASKCLPIVQESPETEIRSKNGDS